jgi:putative RNA 2'-phosphotransferase
MNEDKFKKISKSLSYWLRHHPEDIGIVISSDGWTDIKDLLEKAKLKLFFDFNDLKYVVQNNDKKRFSLSEDMCSIRANQGHSIPVELGLLEVLPPAILYHGTPNKNVDSILKEGLNKGNRHHCHLQEDIETCKNVANRRKGDKCVLKIEALKMRADGHKIYISDNGVYLVDYVPSKYIEILETYK